MTHLITLLHLKKESGAIFPLNNFGSISGSKGQNVAETQPYVLLKGVAPAHIWWQIKNHSACKAETLHLRLHSCWHAVRALPEAFLAGVHHGHPHPREPLPASERAGVQRHSWHESRQLFSLAAFCCRVYENNFTLLVICIEPLFFFKTLHPEVAGAIAVERMPGLMEMFSLLPFFSFFFFIIFLAESPKTSGRAAEWANGHPVRPSRTVSTGFLPHWILC